MITDAQLKAAKSAQYHALRQAERDGMPVEERADWALRAAMETVAWQLYLATKLLRDAREDVASCAHEYGNHIEDLAKLSAIDVFLSTQTDAVVPISRESDKV